MSYYQDEIKKDLQLNEVYTERDVASLLYFGREENIVLCDNVVRFDSNGNQKFKVIEKNEAYLHRNERQSYIIPNRKTVVYKVEKVY